MKHTHTLFLALILFFGYSNPIIASNELIWDGEINKDSRYLFFSPINSKKPVVYKANRVYQTDDGIVAIQEQSSATGVIKMVEVFGGCVIDKEPIATNAILNEKCTADFYISAAEISNAQYAKFLSSQGIESPWSDTLPAVDISVDKALQFVQWLSKEQQKKYQLPSDEQWKYALKAGIKKPTKKGFRIVSAN